MKPVEFVEQHLLLGPPNNNADLGNGVKCGALPVRRTSSGEFESYWKPSPADLELLKAGGLVRLCVFGAGHPPVWVDATPKGHVEELP